VVFCIVFSFNNFFLRETRDGSEAFSGADISRARAVPRSSQTLDREHRWITPVVKARVEWRKKWRENDFCQEH
jgi:hypothetical protein